MKSVKFRERVSVAPENLVDGKNSLTKERRVLRSLYPLAETQLRSEVNEKAQLEGNGECTVKTVQMTQHPKLSSLQEETIRPHMGEATPSYKLNNSEQPFLNPPFAKKSVAIPTNMRTHPFPAVSSRTPSCLPPRPTSFCSKLRPPSSAIRPCLTPHTPTCRRRRHDNIPLTLPSGIMRSGGGGVLRRSAKSNTCQRSHKVSRQDDIAGVRMNLQVELEEADEKEEHMKKSPSKNSGVELVGRGLPSAMQVKPSLPNTYRTMTSNSRRGAWPRELAVLPTYNYYELEKELVELIEAGPETSVHGRVHSGMRCQNPLALQLDQHFLVSVSEDHQIL